MWVGVVFEELSPELIGSRSIDREAAEETYLLMIPSFYIPSIAPIQVAIAASLFCI
jgi:hypothetical protein